MWWSVEIREVSKVKLLRVLQGVLRILGFYFKSSGQLLQVLSIGGVKRLGWNFKIIKEIN